MEKECIAFQFDDVREAKAHMDLEVIQDYGDSAYGHLLYCWDDGHRFLARCRKCGGYVLVQSSEYHGAIDDDYYTDYFPVRGADEADELNRLYNGFDIEAAFKKRYLMMTNLRLRWSEEKGSSTTAKSITPS